MTLQPAVMMLFFLPETILIEVLSLWCKLLTVAKLDSAHCNKTNRQYLLDLLQHKLATFDGVNGLKNGRAVFFMKWCFERKMKLSSLSLFPSYFNQNKALVNEIRLESVQSLQFDGFPYAGFDNNTVFLSIINKCTNLKFLNMSGFNNGSDEMVAQVTNLHQLTTLRLCHLNNNMTPHIMQILALDCQNLVEVKFSITDYEDKSILITQHKNYFGSFLHNNRNLIRIQINIGGQPETNDDDDDDDDDDYDDENGRVAVDWFEILVHNCSPLIEFCDFSCLGKLNVLHVVKMLTCNTKLTHFHVMKYVGRFECSISYAQDMGRTTVYCDGFYDPYGWEEEQGGYNIMHLFNSSVGFTDINISIWSLHDNCIQTIANKNYMTLMYLSIDKCGKWSGLAVCNMLDKCKCLTSLHLLDCRHLNSIDVNALCSHRNILTELTINKTVELLTIDLVALITHSECLVKLNAEHCYQVNRSAVQDFCDEFRPEVVLIPSFFW